MRYAAIVTWARSCWRELVLICLVTVGGGVLPAADSPVDFAADIQPILQQNCNGCHAGPNPASGLSVDSFGGLQKGGGKSGPASVAGNSSGSPLIRYLNGAASPRMPMGKKALEPEAIALVARWIDGIGGAAPKAQLVDASVKAVLDKNCAVCHSSRKDQSGLSVETMDRLLSGGSLQGPAIVPGHSERSPLIQRLRGARQPRMPMNAPALGEQEIDQIAKWIDGMKAGAATVSSAGKKPGWPWTPLAEPALPQVKRMDWVRTPIDAFVLAKLEQKKLAAAPPASSRSLLRRLYYGLVGVPPTPEEMESFLKNPSAEAYKAEVEKLLGDSRYGEKWGRHWLDLVRYSDTRGGAIDYPPPAHVALSRLCNSRVQSGSALRPVRQRADCRRWISGLRVRRQIGPGVSRAVG